MLRRAAWLPTIALLTASGLGLTACSNDTPSVAESVLVADLDQAQGQAYGFLGAMRAKGWNIDTLGRSGGAYYSRVFLQDCDGFGTSFAATGQLVMSNPNVGTGSKATAIAVDGRQSLVDMGYKVVSDPLLKDSVTPPLDSLGVGVPLQITMGLETRVARLYAFTSPANILMSAGRPAILVTVTYPCHKYVHTLVGQNTASRPIT